MSTQMSLSAGEVSSSGKTPAAAQQERSALGQTTAKDNKTYEQTTTAQKTLSNVFKVQRGVPLFTVTSTAADFGCDKDGKMSNLASIQFLNELLAKVSRGDATRVADLADHERGSFLGAVYSFLVLNTGSVNAIDGFSGDTDASKLRFFGCEMDATDLREVIRDNGYRFMRARADEISAAIVLQIERARREPDKYPSSVEFVRNLEVVAARRGLTEYPHLSFVGAEYVSNLPLRTRTLIFESAANTLRDRVHNRDDARTRTLAARV